jgi:hypothetical protein
MMARPRVVAILRVGRLNLLNLMSPRSFNERRTRISETRARVGRLPSACSSSSAAIRPVSASPAILICFCRPATSVDISCPLNWLFLKLSQNEPLKSLEGKSSMASGRG